MVYIKITAIKIESINNKNIFSYEKDISVNGGDGVVAGGARLSSAGA